jgi:hypothetical protein
MGKTMNHVMMGYVHMGYVMMNHVMMGYGQEKICNVEKTF